MGYYSFLGVGLSPAPVGAASSFSISDQSIEAHSKNYDYYYKPESIISHFASSESIGKEPDLMFLFTLSSLEAQSKIMSVHVSIAPS